MEAHELTALGGDVEPVRIKFNSASARPRLLALMSPTCHECLIGADAVAGALEVHHDLAPVLVWMRGLEEDREDDASRESARFSEPLQFWDSQCVVGAHLARQLNRPGLVAWDIYASYKSGMTWDDQLPSPTHWVHQMGDARWGEDHYAGGPGFAAALASVVAAAHHA